MSQDPKHLSAYTYTLLTKSTTCQSKLSILSEQLGTFKYEIEVIGAQFDIDKFLVEVYRVCKNSICIFCGREQFSQIYSFFTKIECVE